MYLYHCSVLYFCVLLGGLWSFLLLLLFSPLSVCCCCDALRVLAGLFLCLFFWMYHFNTVHILLPSQYNFVGSGIVVLLNRLCMLYPFLINEVPSHHTCTIPNLTLCSCLLGVSGLFSWMCHSHLDDLFFSLQRILWEAIFTIQLESTTQ